MLCHPERALLEFIGIVHWKIIVGTLKCSNRISSTAGHESHEFSSNQHYKNVRTNMEINFSSIIRISRNGKNPEMTRSVSNKSLKELLSRLIICKFGS